MLSVCNFGPCSPREGVNEVARKDGGSLAAGSPFFQDGGLAWCSKGSVVSGLLPQNFSSHRCGLGPSLILVPPCVLEALKGLEREVPLADHCSLTETGHVLTAQE